MIVPDSSIALISAFFICVLTGCEKRESVLPDDRSSRCGIQTVIDELPQRIGCRRWREAGRFAYSNICCAVRQMDDIDNRIRCTIAYTNKIVEIMPVVATVRTPESLETWRISVENYVDLVRWGFALMNENLPMDVDMWDFLLRPVTLIRQEIDAHKKWLISKGMDLRRVEKSYHVRMLKDLMDNCDREIGACWYEWAKSRMSARQLENVRQGIAVAFGKLPKEIEGK